MPKRRDDFDERAFAADAAAGAFTQAELAARHGISPSHVGKIMCGTRRPHVREMVAQAREAHLGRARRRLAGLVGEAVGALEAAMGGGSGAAAVAAAREVLRRTLGEVPPAARQPQESREDMSSPGLERALRDLSPETKRLVLHELGGPTELEAAPIFADACPGESAPAGASPWPAA